MLTRIADAIHEGGALAGIELCYNGMNGPNLYSRETPLGPMNLPILTFTNDPVQARAMDREDIRNLRRWHRAAAVRAKQAGFDLVYVYGAHGFGTAQHFLSRRINQRTDEYGGSLENRARLLKELIEDTKDAIGDSCAVPVRILVDEMMGDGGITNAEIRDVIGMLAELPDLWDLAHGSWDYCSGTSRFAEEGHLESYIKGIKALTSKPVVAVGRFTSPDAMVRQVKSGILDLIGAARPSIADPFIPKKIEEGRLDDIRECIGCNICVTGDMTGALSRCTQNPTFMEEWRKGWHPEMMRAKESQARVLVVGAGPAGLSAARGLGLRGYEVALAEASTELGGRVAKECRLPGLAAWGRVRDYRVGQIQKMPNVQVYLDSNAVSGGGAGVRLRPGRDRDRLELAARWRSALPDPAHRDRSCDADLHAGRPDGRQAAARHRAALRRRPLLHGRRAGGVAGQERQQGHVRHAVDPRLGLELQHAGAGLHPEALDRVGRRHPCHARIDEHCTRPRGGGVHLLGPYFHGRVRRSRAGDGALAQRLRSISTSRRAKRSGATPVSATSS